VSDAIPVMPETAEPSEDAESPKRPRGELLYRVVSGGLGLLFFCAAGLLAVVIVRGEQKEDAYLQLFDEIREQSSLWRDNTPHDYEVLFSFSNDSFRSCQDARMTVRDGVPTVLDPACISLRGVDSYSYFPWAAGSVEQLYTWLETQALNDDTEVHHIAYDTERGYITQLVIRPYESGGEITIEYRDLRPLN
jgi:hypothetical protein